MYYSSDPNYGRLTGKRIHITVRGVSLEFVTAPGVFSGRDIDRGSLILAELMDVPDNGAVLDLGCGYGFLGILAAKLKPSSTIFMSDINKLAVKLASINIKLNNVSNATVKQGDLFKPFGSTMFDSIITNPPYSAGMRVIERFVTESARYLTHHGSLQLVAPSRIKERIILLIMRSYEDVAEVGGTGAYKVIKATKPKN